MIQYIARRGLLTLVLILLVAIGVFFLLRLTPGDPVLSIVGTGATPEQIAEMRAALGLDRPVYAQLVGWLAGAVRGNLGESIVQGRSVNELILQRLPVTLELAVLALVVSVCAGVTIGALAAVRGGLVDGIVRPIAVAGMCVPQFVVALVLIYVFGVQLGLVPIQGFVPIRESIAGNLVRVVLPVTALAFTPTAILVRQTRAAVLEALGEDFVRTARAKGLSEWSVVSRHVLRASLLPIVTVIGVAATFLLSGSVVIETVFNIPGMGRLLVEAVLRRDYPVVQGVVLYIAIMTVVMNLVVDVAYAVLDPRIRFA